MKDQRVWQGVRIIAGGVVVVGALYLALTHFLLLSFFAAFLANPTSEDEALVKTVFIGAAGGFVAAVCVILALFGLWSRWLFGVAAVVLAMMAVAFLQSPPVGSFDFHTSALGSLLLALLTPWWWRRSSGR